MSPPTSTTECQHPFASLHIMFGEKFVACHKCNTILQGTDFTLTEKGRKSVEEEIKRFNGMRTK